MKFFSSYLDTVSYEMYGKIFKNLNNKESLYVTTKINLDIINNPHIKRSL